MGPWSHTGAPPGSRRAARTHGRLRGRGCHRCRGRPLVVHDGRNLSDAAGRLHLAHGARHTLGSDANAFAHDFRFTFLYSGLDFNMTLDLFPFTAYSGGIIVVPWDGAVFTASVVDPSGTATNNDISEAFQDGVLVGAEGPVTVKPFGLVGHQLVGFGWSNKERTSLEQDPSNIARLLLTEQFPRLSDPGPILRRILERFFPELLVPVQPLNKVNYTWSIYYNFDQYLWSPQGQPDKGIGLFFRFGASDGVANPVKYAYNVGLGGLYARF